ncbi:MAG: VanZ family protein, partial [Verrucomicrobia bacterium]|nr:VanZ family protein [Verrucomicrobiota bacterium]
EGATAEDGSNLEWVVFLALRGTRSRIGRAAERGPACRSATSTTNIRVPWCPFAAESKPASILKSRLIISTACLAAAAALAVAIFVFTHLPNDKVPRLVVSFGDDKLRHVVSYGLFAALLFVGLRPWLSGPVKTLAWVAGIGTALAIVDELTQPLTGRTCSLMDFIASFGGTLLGGSVMFLVTTFSEQCWKGKPVVATVNPSPHVAEKRTNRPSPSIRQ